MLIQKKSIMKKRTKLDIKNFINNNKPIIIIMFIYFLLTYKFLISHEPWRDEAQAWLIGRDLSLFGMIKQMYYEGHPCLWNLILSFFAKSGYPYFTMNIISYIIMFITAIIILKKAPFSYIGKLALIFSNTFLFSYSVIARSYCLIPLACVLIAVNYKNRHEKPIPYLLSIVFLAWTHIIMLGFAGALLFFFYFDEIIKRRKTNSSEQKKLIYKSLIAVILLLLLFIVPIGLGASLNNLVIENKPTNHNKLPITKNISLNIFKSGSVPVVVFTFMLLMLFMLYEAYYYKTNMKILYLGILYQSFVYLYVYYITLQRLETIIFIIMCIWWIQREDKKQTKPKKVYNFIIITSLILSLIFYSSNCYSNNIRDIKEAYSGSKEAGKFINLTIPNNSLIISLNSPFSSSIIPYIEESKNIQFYGMDSKTMFTYITWNLNNKDFTNEDIKYNILNKFKEYKNIYILALLDDNLKSLEEEDFIKLIFKNNHVMSEKFKIFKVNNEKRENQCL